MELRHLRYFVAVAEHGGFTRAARALHLSQSALSRQIRDLERILGVLLLIRSPEGTRPTAAGEAFYERAVRILAAVDEAAREARLVARKRTVLKVGVAMPLPADLHLSVLAAFGRAHPEVLMSWQEINLAEYDQPLLDGEVDVAVMWLPVDTERLVVRRLVQEPRGLAVPRGHPLWDAETVPATEVLELALAPLRQVSPRVSRYWQLWEERSGEPPRVVGDPAATVSQLLMAMQLNQGVHPCPLFTHAVPLSSGLRVLPMTGIADAACAVVRRRDDRRELPRLFCDFAAGLRV